jgi:hypothetical protein
VERRVRPLRDAVAPAAAARTVTEQPGGALLQRRLAQALRNGSQRIVADHVEALDW